MSIIINCDDYKLHPFADFILRFECGCEFNIGVVVDGILEKDKNKRVFTPYVIDDFPSFKPCKNHNDELIEKMKIIMEKEEKEDDNE